MAVLRANQAIDTRAFDYIEDLFDSGTFRADSGTRFTIVDGPAELRFDGAGFVYGGDEIPDTGTIMRVRARYEESPGDGFTTVWDLNDLNLKRDTLFDLVDQGAEAVVSAVFAGDDQLYGSADADTLQGHGGNDLYFGSAGNDTYYFDDAGDRVIGQITDDGRDYADDGFDTIVASVDAKMSINVERLMLDGEDDINATGNIGNDRLLGNAGDNIINGRQGLDILWGKEGKDIFLFDIRGAAHADRVMDFKSGQDKIALDQTAFTNLDLGKLNAKEFKDIGKPNAKVDADDHVIYNSDYGTLYYDSNGSAAGGRVLIAVLDNEPALKAGDILVV